MTPPSPAVARLLLDPGPDEARRLLARELDRPEYREPFLERVVGWVDDLLATVAAGGDGLGRAASVGVLLLLAGAAVLVLSRLRRGPARAPATGAVFAGDRLGVADHRAAARAAYDASRWDDAVVEAVRALAAGLVERGLVPDQEGVTVHELVVVATARYPAERDDLLRVARSFDEVRYGDRRATEPAARAALDLEARLAATAPAAPTRGPVGPVGAVPR